MYSETVGPITRPLYGGHGEGTGRSTQPAKETRTGYERPGTVPTSLPGIAESYAEVSASEEPGAGKPHAGICAGGAG